MEIMDEFALCSSLMNQRPLYIYNTTRKYLETCRQWLSHSRLKVASAFVKARVIFYVQPLEIAQSATTNIFESFCYLFHSDEEDGEERGH